MVARSRLFGRLSVQGDKEAPGGSPSVGSGNIDMLAYSAPMRSEKLDSVSTQQLDATQHPLDSTRSGLGGGSDDGGGGGGGGGVPHYSQHSLGSDNSSKKQQSRKERRKQEKEWKAAKAARIRRKTRGGAGFAPDRTTGIFMHNARGILDPRSHWMLAWMLIVSVVTIGTAISTPIELAWYESPTSWAADPFFLVFNIIVITIFSLDMAANFNLAYFDENVGALVTSRRKIAKEYFKLWFWFDFLATFPFDACVGNSSSEAAQLFRFFKLFRLLRVFKILGSKRMLRVVEAESAVNYDAFSLAGFGFTMLLLMHVMACGLFYVGSHGDRATTDDDHYGSAFDAQYTAFEINNRIAGDTVFNQWLTCFYWAAMTVATIGYGDITLAGNNTIRAYVTVCMLVGASAYAYMVGALVQVVLNMNLKEQERRMLLSRVNEMTRTIGLPVRKCKEIRHFFSKTNGGQSILEGYLTQLNHLSPPLAAAVVNHMMQDWLPKVWWLQPAIGDHGFLIKFVRLLREQSFAEFEPVFQADDAANVCYVVRVGNVEVRGHGRFFAEGIGIGEEILMHRRQEYGYSVKALTYLDTWRIERDSFRSFMLGYPVLRARVLWTVLATAVMHYGGVQALFEHVEKIATLEATRSVKLAAGSGRFGLGSGGSTGISKSGRRSTRQVGGGGGGEHGIGRGFVNHSGAHGSGAAAAAVAAGGGGGGNAVVSSAVAPRPLPQRGSSSRGGLGKMFGAPSMRHIPAEEKKEEAEPAVDGAAAGAAPAFGGVDAAKTTTTAPATDAGTAPNTAAITPAPGRGSSPESVHDSSDDEASDGHGSGEAGGVGRRSRQNAPRSSDGVSGVRVGGRAEPLEQWKLRFEAKVDLLLREQQRRKYR